MALRRFSVVKGRRRYRVIIDRYTENVGAGEEESH
jgi:hypothetical protein